jgi:hypothetical protein
VDGASFHTSPFRRSLSFFCAAERVDYTFG